MNTGTGLTAECEGVDKSRDGKMFQFPSDFEKTKEFDLWLTLLDMPLQYLQYKKRFFAVHKTTI